MINKLKTQLDKMCNRNYQHPIPKKYTITSQIRPTVKMIRNLRKNAKKSKEKKKASKKTTESNLKKHF